MSAKRRFGAVALVVAGMCVIPVTTLHARAAATTTQLSLTERTVSIVGPADEWVGGGILHVRGRTDVNSVSGDLQGTLTAELDLDVNLASGDGDFHGQFTLATEQATWTGSARGVLQAWEASGTYAGRAGDGSEIFGSFYQTSATTFTDHAEILAP